MRSILRNEYIEWDVECSITSYKTHLKVSKHHKEIKRLLSKCERVFGDLPLGKPPDKEVEHIIELDIGTQPIKINPYKHPKRIIYDIEEDIKELLDSGLIRPSSIPFASSIVMVKTKDGTLRMCIDFGALNKKTMMNRYPIQRIDNIMDEIHVSKLFSKIDLRSGYHQI